LKRLRPAGRISKGEIAPSIPFEPDLLKDLRNAEYARIYLAEALKDDHPGTFKMALRNVIQARRGMTEMAKILHLNRAGLYQALSLEGNPSFSTVFEVLGELGISIDLKKKKA
jgi:probable addiction module antidote protein